MGLNCCLIEGLVDSAEAHGEVQPASAPADSNGQSGRRHQPLIAAFHNRCVLLFAGMLWFHLGPITNVHNLLSLCCFYSSYLLWGIHITDCTHYFFGISFPFLCECSSQGRALLY